MTEIDLEQFEGHTKGPWTDYTAQEVGIKGTRGYCDYCIAIMGDSDMKRPERIANRKLIASAPELLKEVKELRGLSTQLWEQLAETVEENDNLHTAINSCVSGNMPKSCLDNYSEMIIERCKDCGMQSHPDNNCDCSEDEEE